MRQKEMYLENLMHLREVFGEDTHVLTVKQVANYLGKAEQTVITAKNTPVKKLGRTYCVPITNFASWLS
jgi:hypothetical protein